MDSFESILSIIYNERYCVRDTQGIPNSSDHPFFWLLPLASLGLHESKYLVHIGANKAAVKRQAPCLDKSI